MIKKKAIKIFIPSVLKYYRRGGIGKFLSSLRKNLDHNRFQVVHPGVSYCRNEGRRINSADGHFLFSFFRRVEVIKEAFLLPRRVKSYEIDIVHLNCSLLSNALVRTCLFILMSRLRNVKILVFFHGWNEKVEKKIQGNVLFRSLFIGMVSKCDGIVVLSLSFKRKLEEWGIKQDIHVVTTCIDDEFSLEVSRYNIPVVRPKSNDLTILFLSRVELEKGIYEAIEAFRLLVKRYENTRLVIAGDGGAKKAVQKYVVNKGIGNITFLGYVEGVEKVRAFLGADIFLLPSYSEGFPLAVLEAMRCGLPVVTRPVGGVKDFFQDGLHGFITESKSPHVFAYLIERLIVDKSLRDRISAYNKEYAKKHFSVSTVVPAIENIYLSIMQQKLDKI